MNVSILGATLAVLLGGIMEGSFALPMRLAKRWRWENTWMVYSAVGLVVIPWAVAGATVPHLLRVYSSVSSRTILMTGLFGLGWGVANVLFGLAVSLVGMAFSFAVVVGMSAALGSLVPLVLSSSGRLLGTSGLIVIIGVLLTSLGVVLLGLAGRGRERLQGSDSASVHPRNAFAWGMTLCILAGLLAPMLNYSFAFGSEITTQAIRLGASPTEAVNAIWAVALVGGFVSNGGYCLIRLNRNQTWGEFQKNGALVNCALATLMGVLWTGGLLFYGWGASGMGNLGAAAGWPAFQGTMIVTSSFLGIMSGEWHGVKARFFRINNIGLSTVVIAIIILSIGKRT